MAANNWQTPGASDPGRYTNPLRGLFGVSSPQPEEQRDAPQPTKPYENIHFEIPSGMIEKLLANPFAGDGTFLSLGKFCPKILHGGRTICVKHTHCKTLA